MQVNKAHYAAEWVRLEQLRRGDLVVVLDQSDDLGDDTPTLPDATPVTEDLAWLLGAIIEDGTVTKKGIRVAAFGEFRGRSPRASPAVGSWMARRVQRPA